MAPISRSSSISNKRRRIDTSSEELEELPVTSPRKTRLRKASLPARLTSSVRDDYDDDDVDGEGEEEEEEDDEAEPELEHSHSHSVSIEGEAEGEEEEQEQEQEDAEWQEKYKIWEMFADEYHDIVEQLPLELQRSFQLMLEHDEQMRAHEKALENATIEYLSLAKSDAYQDAMIKAQSARKMAAHLGNTEAAAVADSVSALLTQQHPLPATTMNGTHSSSAPVIPVSTAHDLPATVAANMETMNDADAEGEAELEEDADGEAVDLSSGEDAAAAAMAELASAGSHNSEEDIETALIKQQPNISSQQPTVEGASSYAAPPHPESTELLSAQLPSTLEAVADVKTQEGIQNGGEKKEDVDDGDDDATEQLRKLLGDIVTHSRAAIKAGEDKVALAVTAYDWVDRHIHRLDSDLMKHEEALALGLRPGTQPSTDAREAFSHAEDNTLAGHMQDPSGLAGGGKGALPHDTATGAKRKGRGGGGKGKSKGKSNGKSASLAPAEADASLNLNSDEMLFCYCQRQSSGVMIGCDNDDCPYQWFHMDCLGIKVAPSSSQEWFCPTCTAKMGSKKKATSKPKKKGRR